MSESLYLLSHPDCARGRQDSPDHYRKGPERSGV